ncbi:hypothetical protein B7695_01350 [Streptococcus mitis]|uniref:Uncharacterized protein n=1 Tax=Streptococcus mitis TaxID=28037 RepID=A0A1X1L0H6_STRMT|nr:hypothetical protein B7695_01350 [Streptococcus mitis]
MLPFCCQTFKNGKEDLWKNRKTQIKSNSTKRKIGKTTDELNVYFNENATETIQDRLTRIILKELRRKLDEKMILN